MQEIDKLRLTITKLENVSIHREMMGLTFVGCILLTLKETVSTDHFLLSDEAVRIMDTSA